MQQIILALLQLVIAVMFKFIQDLKHKNMMKIEFVFKLCQYITIMYCFNQYDSNITWITCLKMVIYVVHSFVMAVSVKQYLILLVVLVAFEVI